MTLLLQNKFKSYQRIYHKKVMTTPHQVDLEIIETAPKTEDFSMDSFVGDSERDPIRYTFRALYEKDISMRTREKYGITNEVNGIIYLSAIQVTEVLGDYHIDKNKTVAYFNGKRQVIEKLDYLEELFGSCIGIQIFLKDDVRGG